MSRIPAAFRRLKKNNEAALVPYLTVGYPSLQTTRTLLPVIARQGADMIELGVPFSDPLADGATIQRASQAALEAGVTLSDCLSVAAEARRSNEVPILLMSYYNPLHKYGLERFAEAAASSGVDGLIVPDLPPDEAGELKTACDNHNIDVIFLLAPTSTEERIRRVTEMASGFIYCVSLTGVTGARPELSQALPDLISRVRPHTDLPLVASSGISTPEQVVEAIKVADGAIVASALINLIETLPEDDLIIGVSDFIRSMKEATISNEQ